MNWETLSSPNLEIKDVKVTVRETEVHLTWFWPKEVDFVYLYKTSEDEVRSYHELREQDLKLYTREEYKASHGYFGRIDAIGRSAYRIYPCQKRNGQLTIFSQENEKNLIYISGAKAKIYFSITYKNKLFQSRKKVRMTIMTELPLDKELLVYVKKSGSAPVSMEDGTIYPFVRNFSSGKTVPPEIEIDKNEYIRIFVNSRKSGAQNYLLIPE